MRKTFAEIVEEVKQLSFAEKKELYELLVEERRSEIRENADASMKNTARADFIASRTSMK